MIVLMSMFWLPGNSLNTLSMDLMALCPVRSFSFISRLWSQIGVNKYFQPKGWKSQKTVDWGDLSVVGGTPARPAPLPEYSGFPRLYESRGTRRGRGSDTHCNDWTPLRCKHRKLIKSLMYFINLRDPQSRDRDQVQKSKSVSYEKQDRIWIVQQQLIMI